MTVMTDTVTEGNPSSSSDGEINWTKRELLGRQLSYLKRFYIDTSSWSLQEDLKNQLTWIRDSFDDALAYQFSLANEPRHAPVAVHQIE